MRKLLMTGAGFGCLMLGSVVCGPQAYAASEALGFVETSVNGGPETLSVFFTGDPSAVVSVTGTTDNWNIDLAGSGHSVVGRTGEILSWTDPDEAGTFNVMHQTSSTTFTFVSGVASAVGTGPFPSGTSFGQELDVAPGRPDDGIAIFANASERQISVPEPASMAMLGAGLLGLRWARRRRRK